MSYHISMHTATIDSRLYIICYSLNVYIDTLDSRILVSLFTYCLSINSIALYVTNILDTPLGEAIWVYSVYTHNA